MQSRHADDQHRRIDVHIWTMRIDGLGDQPPTPWLRYLSDGELERSRKFVFARNRVEYLAAHALARWAIANAVCQKPLDLRFPTGEHGKPSAWIGDAPCGVEFNLSHANGMVTVALSRDRAVGVDVEALSREVNLDIAHHYFNRMETDWLTALPTDAQSQGFLSLWTLKEAFIKATGKGLSQALHHFGFRPDPPRVFFSTDLPEVPEDWEFDQKVIGDTFIVACGIRPGPGGIARFLWDVMDPLDFPNPVNRMTI
jgi:4'-phosphopantetheinyl transferase